MDDRTGTLFSALVVAVADELNASAPASVVGQPTVQAALATVLSEPGIRVDALARVLGLTGSGGVRLVNRMVGSGHLERRRDPADGRAVTVWLTESGAGLARGVLDGRRAVLGRTVGAAHDGAPTVRWIEQVLAGLVDGRDRADRICRFCEYATCPQDACPVEGAVR